MEEKKVNKMYILMGILAFFILLVLMISWMDSRSNITAESYNGNKVDNPFGITVYYFPSRKNDAAALTYYFNEQGYKVSMSPSDREESLNSVRSGPSYIYFNQEEFEQAMDIKRQIEKVIGYPVNAYRYSDYHSSPSMMMVFTEEDKHS